MLLILANVSGPLVPREYSRPGCAPRLFSGGWSHLEEDTEALDEDKAGSSPPEDSKAGKSTGVGDLESREQKEEENMGSWAPRLGPVGLPFQLRGWELDPESQPTV